ncbi:MAG TPA: ketoacyl reductase, partial [Planctomycetaceae bacterium]|nr:ketoacyl reductase [Planctomycetaceae bacterium]
MKSSLKQQLVWASAGLGLALAGRSLYRRMNRLNLSGRTVLITGGSRGLGLVLARQFAAQGAKLILCGRNKDKLLRAGKELFENGANVSCITCDVTQPDQVKEMVSQIERHFNSIDVVVNNAG